MNYILTLLFCLIAAFPAVAQESQIEDNTIVRGFIWGLPMEVVKENETATFMSAEDNALFFFDIIDGRRSTIGYEFKDNKLWRVKIFNEKKYYNPQDRIDDLLTIQKDIIEKFGEPTKENMEWFERTEVNNPYGWGWAVYRSELIMTSNWYAKDTEVRTYLGAKEKFKPTLSVTYTYMPTKQEEGTRGLLLVP